MSVVIPLLLFVPLVFGVFSFIFKIYSKMLGLIFSFVWLCLAVVLIVFVQNSQEVMVYNFGGFEAPLGIEFRVTPLSSFMIGLSAFLIFITSIYARFYLKEKDIVIYYPLIAFLSCAMTVLFLSRDIFNLYVALELIGLSAVALSALGAKNESIKSAIGYLFASLAGSGFYLLAVALIYANYSTLHIDELSYIIEDDFITNIALILIIIGLCIKTALFPFHYWLPNAHSNALSPVSALLSAIVIKTSFYLLYILIFDIFTYETVFFKIMGYFGVVAIFYGAIQAIYSKDFKVMIAYSTVSQVGYLFVVFAISSSLAIQGAFFALLSHSLAKGGLFLASGVIIMVIGSKNIIDLKGVSNILPLSVFTVALSAISLIGFPPSLGFVSKWYYLQATLNEELIVFFIAIAFGSVLSAVYLFKILILSLSPSVSTVVIPNKSGFKVLQWCAFILSFLSVVLGLVASKISILVGL
ncbi:complex I subunit 5 family protein [Arcobacter sp. FWKO B]|uniref:complex I subunit 5 family protein n=1 Tax=Arcobacter sp. FWKO B TaxID=2593672 RepID=UPI0018A566B6|nr:proton-conducting transporter membrane subunit [Arcobacter sp. FWKO B]QOG13157.1 oxidoreductase [Arcobacter sp. FWKO B]